MKAGFECMPCILTQALNTARLATDDEGLVARVMAEAHDYSRAMDLEMTPTQLCTPLYRMVEGMTGCDDPYAGVKRQYNDLAMELRPQAENLLLESSDRLHTALKLAAAGNVIDLGIGLKFDLKKVMVQAVEKGFAVDDYQALRDDLAGAGSLLILGDNAGEIVFDLLLLQEIAALFPGLETTYAVKAGPIINDSTLEDAHYTGLDRLCRVITSGCRSIGTPLDEVDDAFREAFDSADVVLGKGHGHYESLCRTSPRTVYYLLRAKCPLVAASLGVRVGEAALKRQAP